MARVTFATDLQQYTDGVKYQEVASRNYRALVAELCQQFPRLTSDILNKYALAIDGVVVSVPLLETFGENSELVFVARIAGG